MTKNDILTLAQRLREYNHNPHHINPASDAFHGLITDSADALAQLAAIQGGMGEVVEVVAWRIEHPVSQWKVYEQRQDWAYQQYGHIKYEVQDLMTVAQHQRITAAMAAEVERLSRFEAAYNEWQEKTDWVQKTIKSHELGKHRADVLKDRLARWLERISQPYDYADVEAAQQKEGN